MNGQDKMLDILSSSERSLFYRKARALGSFYENCDLPAYTGKALYPSGKIFMPSNINGLALNFGTMEKPVANYIKETYCKPFCFVSPEHCVAAGMYTHSMPHYERILKEGLYSYYDRIRKIENADLQEGLCLLLDGIRVYVDRIVAYLESADADEQLINALRKVPMYPAETIYEAIVCWNFVLYLDGCDNLGCVASGLYPYYAGENVIPLLQNLFDNLDVNDEGYSMALPTEYNPLTLQCLEAAKGKRRPMIELFVDENTPQEIWEKAFELVRTMSGQPAFYNPSALLGGLQKRIPSITDADIQQFCGGGCTESMIAGLSNVGSLDAGINMLLLLESCIYQELEKAESFEDFYTRYIRVVENTVEQVTQQISASQRSRAQSNPLPMRTLLIDDCIDNGLDYNQGGARYQWSIISFAGLVNVIDALLVIQEFVFDTGRYSVTELIQKMKHNDAAFQKEAKNCKTSYGNDDVRANAFANRFTKDVFSMLDERKPYYGEAFIPASIMFQAQATAGKNIGCTPDGRCAGAPLADSLGAIFGKDVKGPTALLNSVTSLDLGRALGVPVLNFNLNPDFKNEVLQALILGYMRQGGIQMQITCISKEMLEDAYKDPQSHKNLIVRVGGYSEYFYRLSDDLKRMILERTIQSQL